jgi:hypothetical protein
MAHDFTPVFIGGTGRSGTTILLNLLNRHPDFHASMPREIKYLTSRHGLVDIALTRLHERFRSWAKAKYHFLRESYLVLGGQKLARRATYAGWFKESLAKS